MEDLYKVDIFRSYKNTDKFRPAAKHFEEYGFYTAAPAGTTEYKRYWDREVDRCINGFTTEDGERVTGYHYFYLNYSPIMKVVEKEVPDGKGGTRIMPARVRGLPDFWDYDKEFFDAVEAAENRGSHMSVLKKRRSGYSFKAASMLNRNFFLIPESTSYAIASEKEFLTKDGVLSKAWDMMSWIDDHTAWTKKRQASDTQMHKRASFYTVKEGTKIEQGYMSEIIGVTLKNDPQKARGKAAKLILWEESGKFPGLLQAWQIAQPSVEQDGIAFGTMIAFGTGGTEEADYSSLKELFYKPKAYNILPIENIWDDGAQGTESGFFVPNYMNMQGYMDEEGNSLVNEAIQESNRQRREVEEHSGDKNSIDRYIAEHPSTPMEATLQLTSNIFPKKELQQQLAKVMGDKKLRNYKQVGELYYDGSGRLRWTQTTDVKDIEKFPLDKNDSKKGAIVIWEHPVEDPPYGLYIAGSDPYDHDDSGTASLGSTFIYKRFQSFEQYYDIIVAEYTGRPDTADEYYENVLKLLKYYNARLLYENERKGMFAYFSMKGYDYMLANQPDIIHDIVQVSKVQRKKGIHMTKGIKDWAEREIRDWLNEEYSPGHKNLEKIFSIPLLRELISYNDKGNFDRCLVKDTKISTLEGFKNVQDIDVGDKVITHNGNIKSVSLLDKHKPSEDVLKFKVVGNYEPLVLTGNHPIYSAYTDKVKHNTRIKALDNKGFVNAEDLKYKYQFVLLPKRKELENNGYGDDMMYLLGWYISDGYTNKDTGKIEITLQSDQMNMAKELARILDENSEGESRVGNNGRIHIAANSQINNYGNYIQVCKTSRKLSEFLINKGGKSHNKALSSDIYNSSNLLMLAIGYLEGDGHQRKNSTYDGYRREYIEVGSIYETLAKQIRQILIDNGIWSSIRYVKPRSSRHNPQYCLTISRGYINKIAEYSYKFWKVPNKNINKKNYQYETDEGFWTPIRYEGKVDYSDYVYNFEVEDDNSYLASGVGVHNCIALMMIMLYKKELHNVHVKDKKRSEKTIDKFFQTTFFTNDRKFNFNRLR